MEFEGSRSIGRFALPAVNGRLGDEFWMIRDVIEAEDESEPPTAEFDDALGADLAAVGAAYDSVQRSQAFLIENLHRAHDVYVRSRDSVLADSGSETSVYRLGDDQAMERSFVAEVAAQITVSDKMAEAMIREAVVLVDDLPEVMDAFRVGFISYLHARTAAQQAWSIPKDVRADFDAELVQKARTQTPARFRQTARKLREKLHPESIQARKNTAFENRHVEHTPAEDGMAYLGLYHSADVTLSLAEQTTTHARRIKAGGDDRTLPQIEADLLAQSLLVTASAPAAPGPAAENEAAEDETAENETAEDEAAEDETAETGDDEDDAHPEASVGDGDTVTLTRAQLAALRPGVVVTVPVLSLLGHSPEPADLAGYGPIDPETAAQLIGQATSFTRVLTDPVTGEHRLTDPNTYRLSTRMKRAIRLRDITCDFPGCDASARRCDIDHIIAWEHGGRSTQHNLHALCRKHHTLKHSTSWTPRRLPDGTVQWTSPAGTKHIVKRE